MGKHISPNFICFPDGRVFDNREDTWQFRVGRAASRQLKQVNRLNTLSKISALLLISVGFLLIWKSGLESGVYLIFGGAAVRPLALLVIHFVKGRDIRTYLAGEIQSEVRDSVIQEQLEKYGHHILPFLGVDPTLTPDVAAEPDFDLG